MAILSLPWCAVCNGWHERWVICRSRLNLPKVLVLNVPVRMAL